ncbi:MAG: OsmC family protein [Pseudomonadota bacterium]
MEIKVKLPGGKKVNAEFNGFTVNTDQSVENGGQGTAPEPFSLFLASLATCAGVYVNGFCQNRGISTENIELTQNHEFAEKDGKMSLSKVIIDIKVPADFPEKYLDSLIRVANMCTVKRTLLNPPEFEIQTEVKNS